MIRLRRLGAIRNRTIWALCGVWSKPKVAKHPSGVDSFVLRLGGALFAFCGWNAPTDGRFFQIGREILGFDPKQLKFSAICVTCWRRQAFYKREVGLCEQGSRPPPFGSIVIADGLRRAE